jgi:tetratricopeptide (TPR) repeat protein
MNDNLEKEASHIRMTNTGKVLIETQVYLLLFFTPLAIGTVHLWSQAVMLALAISAFGGLLFFNRQSRAEIRLYPMGVALLAVSGLTLLQCVPLPAFMIEFLNPEAASLYQYVLPGAGLWGTGEFRSLSLDSSASSIELIKYLAYALTFITVVNYFNNRYRIRRLLKILAWSGFIVALVGLFSKLFMAQEIYGIYPVPPGTFFFSTFVNPNHLAGYLCLCSPIALGLAMTSRERQDKALFGFMGVIIGVGVFMTLSRGGIIAYMATLGLLVLFAGTAKSRKIKKVVLVQFSVVGVLALSSFLAYDTVVSEMKTVGDAQAIKDYTKIRSWQGILPMIADHPVVGIGRGAFKTAYPRYKSVESNRTFTHAENELLQVMAEWGPFFGLLFVGVLILLFIVGMSKAKYSYTLAGCLAGVFGLALHNLVDFSLETGGVAIPFVIVLAVLSFGLPIDKTRITSLHQRLAIPKFAGQFLAVITLAAALVVISQQIGQDLEKQSKELVKISKSETAEPCQPGKMGQLACELMDSHPADYFIPLVIGKSLLEVPPLPRLRRAMHWLSRAIYLNPSSSTAHRLAGRTLYLSGYHQQSLGEYQLAAQHDPTQLTAIIVEVLRLSGDPENAVKAIPKNDPQGYMTAAKIFRNLGKNAAAQRTALLALEIDSSLLSALDLLSDLAIKENRLHEAVDYTNRTIEIDPTHEKAYLLQAQAYSIENKPDKKEEVLIAGFSRVPDSATIAYRLGHMYLMQNKIDKAEEVASRLESFVSSDDLSQAQLNLLVGKIYEKKGSLLEARRAYRQAVSLAPKVNNYAYHVGLMEQKLSNWEEAEKIFHQLFSVRFREEEMRKRLDEVKLAKKKEKDQAMMKMWGDDIRNKK